MQRHVKPTARQTRGLIASYVITAMALSGGAALAAEGGGAAARAQPGPAAVSAFPPIPAQPVAQGFSLFNFAAAAPEPQRSPTAVDCANQSSNAAGTQIQVSEQKGRALIEVSRPKGAGQSIEVEYGDELYTQKFGTDGRLRLAFALTAAENQFTINMSEAEPVTCSVKVPEFAKIYRAILRWHDPVQLDLNVLEPGGRAGDYGNVSGGRPNSALKHGVGQMDIVGGVPGGDATGEMSYEVDAAAVPPGSVFGFKVDFVTRGSQAEPPYCDDHRFAAPKFDFITIENGKVSAYKLGMNHAHCHDKIPDDRRLMPIRR